MAIDLITEHIRMKLQQPELRRIYHNLELMPSNFQIRGMHTLIRDRTTSKADFVFYADRLLRLVTDLQESYSNAFCTTCSCQAASVNIPTTRLPHHETWAVATCVPPGTAAVTGMAVRVE